MCQWYLVMAFWVKSQYVTLCFLRGVIIHMPYQSVSLRAPTDPGQVFLSLSFLTYQVSLFSFFM
jgi:hypothetical protein